MTEIGTTTKFQTEFSQEVWENTYKHHTDNTIDDTFRRVARDIASAEETEEKKREWEDKFYEAMSGFKVIPGGRIMANAGTGWEGTTMMNCVSGETKVHTIDGLAEARSLAGKIVKTLSKDGLYREATWSSYGNQRLYKVTFENNEIVYATADHKWVVSNPRKGVDFSLESRCSTKDLIGKRVPIQGYVQTSYDSSAFKAGVQHGLVYGDGWETKNKQHTTIAQFKENSHLIVDNFDLVKFAEYKGDNLGRAYAYNLPGYYKELPMGVKNISYLRGFIAGIVASDGSIDMAGHVMIFQADLDDITNIRQLCANAGIPSSSMVLYREKSPWDDSSKPLYCIRLFKNSFWYDRNLVIKNKHKEYLDKSPQPKYLSTLKVVSVEETERYEEVYCCVEPETHTMVIGSGILTGQCYVGPLPERDLDSIDGIYQVLVDQANTLKSEGGWGMDFSWIRPRGAFIGGIGVESPGSIRFMELFDKSSDIITSGSGKKSTNGTAKKKIRKGAMMATLSVTHPDIIEFITAKQTQGRLAKFNMSVNCTDDFMALVNIGDPDADWNLEFPDTKHPKYKTEWRGNIKAWKAKGYETIVHNTVKVQWLWNLIMESTYNRNEPGVLFLDRANAFNPLSYAEYILSTNPCVTGDMVVTVKIDGNEETCTVADAVSLSALGSNVQIYSRNIATGKDDFHPVSFAGMTRRNAEIIKITDSATGKFIKVTPDHKVYTQNRGYVEAKDLKETDVLMFD